MITRIFLTFSKSKDEVFRSILEFFTCEGFFDQIIVVDTSIGFFIISKQGDQWSQNSYLHDNIIRSKFEPNNWTHRDDIFVYRLRINKRDVAEDRDMVEYAA